MGHSPPLPYGSRRVCIMMLRSQLRVNDFQPVTSDSIQHTVILTCRCLYCYSCTQRLISCPLCLFIQFTLGLRQITRHILADHTNGRVYGTMLCPSVVLSVCSLTHVLWLNYTSFRKKCLKKQIGLPDRYPVAPIRIPYEPIPQNGGTDCTAKYLHCELRPNRFSQ